jgi:hypothetical protein
MSVLGEFRRASGEAVACLNDSGQGAAQRLALELEGASAARGEDLSDAATRVLGIVERAQPAQLAADDGVRARLEDATERLLALCRIILGRG